MNRFALGFACVLALASSVGCQAMYGGRPEALKNPVKKKRPPEAAEKVVYDEECKAEFFAPTPKNFTPSPSQAAPMVERGKTELAAARRSTDPQQRAQSLISSINSYKAALVKDPYNPEATLQLAIAYDAVQKKGCAIALLKRLAALQGHEPVADTTRAKLDEVSANETMFRGYRKDAVSAIGR